MRAMNTTWNDTLDKANNKRERVTWRLDPTNYDFVNRQRTQMRLTSMNAALNVILSEHREKCCQSERKAKSRK